MVLTEYQKEILRRARKNYLTRMWCFVGIALFSLVAAKLNRDINHDTMAWVSLINAIVDTAVIFYCAYHLNWIDGVMEKSS